MIHRIVIATTLLALACTPKPSDPPAEPEIDDHVAQPRVTESEAEPEPDPDPSASCPEPAERHGFDDCWAVELTGAGPCEDVCRQRSSARASKCCEDPTEVVVFSGPTELLRVSACESVPPECGDVHGHGNMDAQLRVLTGPPVELVVVEGGCEMRALAHGYVPDGVAAWTGCIHQRYRWDGERLVEAKH